jgi:signal transduction histidine kinase
MRWNRNCYNTAGKPAADERTGQDDMKQGRLKDTFHKQGRNLTIIYSGILCIGLLAAFVLDRVTASYVAADQREYLQRIAERMQSRADVRLNAYRATVKNLALFMDFTSRDAAEQFRAMASVLSHDTPSIINIALAEDYVVTQVFPEAPNRSVVGVDYRNLPDQLGEIEAMRGSGEAIALGPIDLVQGGRGLIVRAAGNAEKNAVYSVVLELGAFMTEVGIESNSGYIAALRTLPVAGTDEPTLLGNPLVWQNDPVTGYIRINESSVLQVGLVPASGWIAMSPYRLEILLVLASIAAIGFYGVDYARRLIRDRAEARRQLVSAIESIQDGFVIFDENDRLLMCNERYRAFYDKTSDLLVPGNSFEYILLEGVARGQYVDAIGREEDWIAERLAAHRHPNGPIEQPLHDGRWVKIANSKTYNGHTVGFHVDITELKTALNRAELAAQAKADFLNNMSHEFRTPLAIVLGYIAFLKHVTILPHFKALSEAIGDNPPVREKLDALASNIATQAEKTDRSGRHLMGLINSVLDWSTLSGEHTELVLEETDLSELLRNLQEEMQNTARKKGLELQLNLSGDAPAPIPGDSLRLRQIFINLIANAIKFTDQGHVRVSLRDGGAAFEVTVEDTGPGIPEAKQSEIFERFAQVDSSSKRKHGGAGLGLAICKSLAELHGGRITLQSTEGVGSRFTVHLPKAALDTDHIDVNTRRAAA